MVSQTGVIKETRGTLCALKSQSSLHWDCNNVMSRADKKGGLPCPNWLINGLAECGLVDMHLTSTFDGSLT